MVEAEEDPVRRERHSQAPRHQQQVQAQAQASYYGRSVSQSRLHNFSFPSSWGSQRLLRCAKVEPRAELPAHARGGSGGVWHPPLLDRGPAADDRGKRLREAASVCPASGSRARDRKVGEEGGDGEREEDEPLEKFRDAMMAEFRRAFDRIPLPPPRLSGVQPGEKEEKATSPAAASTVEAARPWNLRLRRAACNAPVAKTEKGKTRLSPSGPEKNSGVLGKYSLRSDAGTPKEERPKFSPVLSKEEIEEDFFVMTGSKPPRRPNKRPRNVQKQLENIYPGFYLTEVTPDMYKITEDK